MTGRYSIYDLHTYGAEDDQEMDAILDAIERDDESHAQGLRDWEVLLGAAAYPVRDLARNRLPDAPGVYLFRRRGVAQYVGTATSVRQRVRNGHLASGTSLAGSSLRRNVCHLLFAIPPSRTANPHRQKVTSGQALAIRDWIRGCEVSWVQSDTPVQAAAFEKRLRKAQLPPLNRV